jgi:hypothetical protein
MPPWTPPPGAYKRKGRRRGSSTGPTPAPPPPPTPTAKSYRSASSADPVPFEEFQARLYELMWKAQALRGPAEQVAWGAQVQTLLNDALPMHQYRHQFELTMIGAERNGIAGAYGVLQSLREDADRGHLRHYGGRPYRPATHSAASPPTASPSPPAPVQPFPVTPAGASSPPTSPSTAPAQFAQSQTPKNLVRQTVDWYLRPYRRRGGPITFVVSATPRVVSLVFVGVLLTMMFPDLTGLVAVATISLAAACGIEAARRMARL